MRSSVAIQVLPLGNLTKDEIYHFVDMAIEELKHPELKIMVCPFETVVEGPEELLWEVIKKAHQAVIKHHPSCASYIKFFSAPDLGTTEEKLSRHS